MDNTSRFSRLLGECRRQMNGAVVGSMRFYGVDYGLNYGVSLPTIRTLAKAEGKDHKYACYLYLQQVREIRLSALHIAEPQMINTSDLVFWADGIINSEVAEEAAFALFQYVDCVVQWLSSENDLLIYTALLATAKSRRAPLNDIAPHILRLTALESMLLNSAIITLLESYYREDQYKDLVKDILRSLPSSKSTDEICSEIEWRCELV